MTKEVPDVNQIDAGLKQMNAFAVTKHMWGHPLRYNTRNLPGRRHILGNDVEIITLDLYREGIDFLSEEGINMHRPNPGEGRDHPILKYAYQFVEADKYVFAEPLWNLGIPAILKAYFDYICVTGITFKYTAEGPVGLCQGKKAVNITARGGEYSEGPFAALEMGDRYIKTILGFLGVTDYTTISANRLDVIGEDVEAIVGHLLSPGTNDMMAGT